MKHAKTKITSTNLIRLVFVILLICAVITPVKAEDNGTNGDYLSRLFISPKGSMLPSGVINIALGGSFASQGGHEYLGLFSVGLGDVAEFEVSTSHLVTNIIKDSEPIGTTALKFKLYQNKPGSYIPTFIMALRSNHWSSISEDSRDEMSGPAGGDDGLSGVDFETHLTSLYLTAGYELSSQFTLHGGVVWHEMMTRNLEYYSMEQHDTPGNLKDGVVSVFAGLEHTINPHTHSILEFGSKPRLEFAEDLEKIKVKQLWHGMAGIRFYVKEIVSFDSAIRYRSDYSGLSDAEIRAGLNVGFDLRKELEKVRKKK